MTITDFLVQQIYVTQISTPQTRIGVFTTYVISRTLCRELMTCSFLGQVLISKRVLSCVPYQRSVLQWADNSLRKSNTRCLRTGGIQHVALARRQGGKLWLYKNYSVRNSRTQFLCLLCSLETVLTFSLPVKVVPLSQSKYCCCTIALCLVRQDSETLLRPLFQFTSNEWK